MLESLCNIQVAVVNKGPASERHVNAVGHVCTSVVFAASNPGFMIILSATSG